MALAHPSALVEHAPAKINLSLRILGRRADGYHLLESLVVFADVGDRLTLTPGGALDLAVGGPGAEAAGAIDNNLVIRAARALAQDIPGLAVGRFALTKRLPVAAGVGGGSSDAAAALRLLARVNGLRGDDERLFKAGRGVGADVPVCVEPKARWMRGIGERLSGPVAIPRLAAVLVNPRIGLETKHVFAELARSGALAHDGAERGDDVPAGRDAFLAFLAAQVNDLEPPAVVLQPAIAGVLDALRGGAGCRLARMSGSGATCFGLYASSHAAEAAARDLRAAYPAWWVRATVLR